MKLFFFLIGLLSAGLAYSQSSFMSVFQNDRSFFTSVLRFTDGGYILSGYEKFIDGTSFSVAHSAIVKTDSSGNVEWSKATSSSAFHVFDAALRYDNSIAVAGMMETSLASFDPNGNLLWAKDLDMTTHAVKCTKDSGLIVCGEKYDSTFGFIPGLAKLNSVGDTLWIKYYKATAEQTAVSVIQAEDEGFIFLVRQSSNVFPKKISLIRTNNTGDTIWTRSIDQAEGSALTDAGDGNFIIAGILNNNGCIIKMDTTGNVAWGKEFNSGAFTRFFSVNKTADDGFILAGSKRTVGTGVNDIVLVRTNSFGDTLWTRTIESPGHEEAYSAIEDDDGNIIVAGFWNTTSGLLLKTDANGMGACFVGQPTFSIQSSNLLFSTDTIVIMPGTRDSLITPVLINGFPSQPLCITGLEGIAGDNDFVASPIPFTGNLNLVGLRKGGTISIFEMTGKMVYCIDLPLDEISIHLDFLANGIYILTYKNSRNGISVNKKIIKE